MERIKDKFRTNGGLSVDQISNVVSRLHWSNWPMLINVRREIVLLAPRMGGIVFE